MATLQGSRVIKTADGRRIWQYRQAGVGVVVCGHYHVAYQKRWGSILFSASGVSRAGKELGTCSWI